MGVLTTDLLTSIKDRSFMPISQSTLQDANILAISYETARNYVAPMILKAREDYFLTYEDVSITASVDRYTISERALGTSLKTLSIIDANGKVLRRLERADVSQREMAPQTGEPTHFYLEGDDIILVPMPNQTQNSLRQHYFRRQSELVLPTECAKITAVSDDGTDTTFTVDTDLTGSLSVGSKVDFQNAESPFKLWAWNVSIGTITSSSIIVTSSSVASQSGSISPAVGDYICPRLKTCIPQLPEEWHTVLAQKVVCTLLGTSLGDAKKYQVAMNELKSLEDGAMKTIGSRVESSPKRVNSRNGILSAINGRMYRGFRN